MVGLRRRTLPTPERLEALVESVRPQRRRNRLGIRDRADPPETPLRAVLPQPSKNRERFPATLPARAQRSLVSPRLLSLTRPGPTPTGPRPASLLHPPRRVGKKMGYLPVFRLGLAIPRVTRSGGPGQRLAQIGYPSPPPARARCPPRRLRLVRDAVLPSTACSSSTAGRPSSRTRRRVHGAPSPDPALTRPGAFVPSSSGEPAPPSRRREGTPGPRRRSRGPIAGAGRDNTPDARSPRRPFGLLRLRPPTRPLPGPSGPATGTGTAGPTMESRITWTVGPPAETWNDPGPRGDPPSVGSWDVSRIPQRAGAQVLDGDDCGDDTCGLRLRRCSGHCKTVCYRGHESGLNSQSVLLL